MSKGLFVRMQSEIDAALVGASAEDHSAVTSEAATAAQEVEGASGDVTEVDTGIENALEAGTELQSIEAGLAEAVESNEGVTPREAEHIQARLERVASLLGVTVADMGMTMRRESFGGVSGRLHATKLRLEAAQSFGEKVWEALKNGWQWLKDAVVNFFTRMTKNTEALEKRIKMLQSRVNNMATKSTDTKKNELSARAKEFSVKGDTSFQTIKDLLGNVKNHIELAVKAAGTIKGFRTTGGEKTLDSSVEPIKQVLVSQSGLKAATADLPKETAEGAVACLRTIKGQAYVVIPKKETVGSVEHDFFELRQIKVDDKLADSYKALDFAQMRELGNLALESAKAVRGQEKLKSEFVATVENNIRYCEEVRRIAASKADKVEGDAREEANDAVNLAIAAQKLVQGIVRSIVNTTPKLNFDLVYAAADVLDASLSNLEEKKK